MNKILSNQHVSVFGQTGSGKSYLTERYLAGFDFVVMLDSKLEMLDRQMKGQELWRGVVPKTITLVERLSELPDVKTPKIIYSPALDEMNEDYYNEFFRWCYMRQNCIVWVDEAMQISPNAQRIPEYYKAILTRGRSRNTAVWSLSQRPSGLHNIIFSQSTHIFTFNLNLPADRDKLAKSTGDPQFYQKPGRDPQTNIPYFWYFRDGWEAAIRAKLVE